MDPAAASAHSSTVNCGTGQTCLDAATSTLMLVCLMPIACTSHPGLFAIIILPVLEAGAHEVSHWFNRKLPSDVNKLALRECCGGAVIGRSQLASGFFGAKYREALQAKAPGATCSWLGSRRTSCRNGWGRRALFHGLSFS